MSRGVWGKSVSYKRVGNFRSGVSLQQTGLSKKTGIAGCEAKSSLCVTFTIFHFKQFNTRHGSVTGFKVNIIFSGI